MKHLFLIGCLVLAFSLPAFADFKIALIDTGKVFDTYYKTKTSATQIATMVATYKKEVEKLQYEYDQASQEAQNLAEQVKNPGLPTAARKDKDVALAQKVQDLKLMERELNESQHEHTQEVQDELTRVHQQIADEITKVITDYVKPEGYDLIIDTSAVTQNRGSLITYRAGTTIDLTEQIIEKLNASAPSK